MPETSMLHLHAENTRLKKEVTLLKEQLAFHKRHQPKQTANDGEKFVRDLLGGEFSSHNAAHDLVVGKKRFEIKASNWSSVDNKKPLSSTRWIWHRILGNTGQKIYDRLILLGKVDARHSAKYLDLDSPYVIFDIPIERAKSFLSNTTPPFINVTTNPDSQRTSKGKLLWEFQITSEDLKQRHALKKPPRE